MTAAALILAAGASSRFGSPKALLPFGPATLIDHLTRAALDAACSPVIRVLGAHRDAITAAAPPPSGVTDHFNPAWADGMGNSIASGIRAALTLAPGLRSLVILTCDQPLVTKELIQSLAATILASPDPAALALCDYANGTLGPPAAFGPAHFPALLSLRGDQGARTLTRAHADKLARIPFPEGHWDIDTPEAWTRFLQR